MTARPQTSPGLVATVCPSPHAPPVRGPRPRGVPASAGQHTGLTGRATALFQHLGLAMGGQKGRLFTGFEEAGQRGGQGHHPESRRLDDNAPSVSDPLCHQCTLLGDTWASCCVSPFPSATSHCMQSAAPHAALRCPVSGRGGGKHHCAPTLCARRFVPSPQSRKARPEEKTRTGSPDLGRASSEWQLGLLHAV